MIKTKLEMVLHFTTRARWLNTLLLLMLVLFHLPVQAAETDGAFTLSEEEQAWLKEHPEVRVGMMDAWAPFDFVDTRGVPSGIGVDYIAAINKRLGGVLQLVPGAWDDIYNGVKNRELDALLDITPKPEREAHFNFTTPYLDVPHVIVAPKEAPFLNNENELKGKTVALEQGFGNVNYFKQNFPQVTIREYRDTSHALDAVARGEADAYAGNRSVALYLMGQEVMTTLKVHGRLQKSGSILAIGTRKDWPMLATMLDRALADLSQEEIRQIHHRWVSNGQKDAVAESAVSLTAGERAWIDEHPSIRIAFDGNYPPYSFQNDQGEFVGIAVDFARELAGRVGIELEIYPDGQWKQLYAAAQQHEVDVIATLVKRPGRDEWFDFTRPYISLAQYVITRKEDMQSINQKTLLAGKTVALVEGYSMTEVLLEEIQGIKPHYVSSLSEALEAVSIGKVDATVGAIGMSYHLLTQAGLSNLGFATLYSKGQSEQRFGVRKDWPELATILDKALQSLSDREVMSLFGRWTSPQITMAEAELVGRAIELNTEEQAWLAEHPVIRIASDPAWAPVEFRDDEGNYHGIAIDYLQQLEAMLNIRMEIAEDVSWVDGVALMRNKQLDMVSSMVKTPKREEYAVFTEPYVSMPVNIFARDDVSYIGDLKALMGKRVVVTQGYAIQEWLKDDHPDIQFTTVNSTERALRMVEAGKADAFVGNVVTASYYIGKLRLSNVRVAGETPYAYHQSMAVRDDWPILAGILQKGLDAIEQSERDAIYNRWMSIKYEHGFDYTLLWQVLAGVVLLFIAFTYWNRRLTIEIHERQQAQHQLSEANERLKELDRLKSMFIASMSHELRTPLNSIIGFTGMMLQGVSGELNEEQTDNLHRVYRSGQHLLDLISDVIDISKIEAGRIEVFPQRFPLKEVVDEAVELIQPQADKKQLSLKVEASSWPEMYSDRKRLLQCLLNYLSNSVKFTEQGSVTVVIQELNGDVDIAVHDTGIGIASTDIPKLFEAFERLETHLRVKAGGSGLGLYLTKKIASDLLQGKVQVKSEVNQGSTFSLRIPVEVSGIDEPNETLS